MPNKQSPESIYKSADLSVEYLESLSEDIYAVVHGYEGLTMDQYISRAKNITSQDLGVRKLRAIHAEEELNVYFPDEILDILKKLDHEKVRFNDSDYDYLRQFKNYDYHKLSILFYTSVDQIKSRLISIGLTPITRTANINKSSFTEQQDNILKANAWRGTSWLSKHLSKSHSSIKRRANSLNLTIPFVPFGTYFPEDDAFIKNNSGLGAEEIAKRINRTKRSVQDRANLIGVKLKIIRTSYTPEQDKFISKYADRGSRFLAEKLGKSQDGVRTRAKQLGVTLKVVNSGANSYNEEDDRFIRMFSHKGSKWLSMSLKRSTRSVRERAQRIGIKLGERNDKIFQ